METGLLFEINRRILHPLGVALEMIIDDKTGEVRLGEIWDCRCDKEGNPNLEGMVFDKEIFLGGSKKYTEFMEREGNTKLETRKRKLGFIVQTKPVVKGGKK
jgi:hypothetical protein